MSRGRAVAHAVLSPLLSRAARAYLVGGRDDAVRLAGRLAGGGYAVTLAYWHGEADDAGRVLAENLEVVAQLADTAGSPQVAVKAPGLAFGESAVGSLARAAAGAGVGLLFDAHAPEDAPATLDLAAAAAAAGARVGVALPARWRRSLADAETAVAGGLAVRVVKGQWTDVPPSSGHLSEPQFRAAYLELVRRLAGRVPAISLATHDSRLLDEALGAVSAAGTAFEAELLLGLPGARPLAKASRHAAPVRFYLAYGHPSLVYSPGAVLHRPRLAATLLEGVVLGAGNQRLRRREALRRGGEPLIGPQGVR